MKIHHAKLSRSHTVNSDQRGLVSFLVTMILMIVVTLIVIGFTQLTISSRQDALDKQLSTQAFYAAETGVNDVLKVLKQQYALDPTYTPAVKDKCNMVSVYNSPSGNQLSDNVSYTCVLVTPNSTRIESSASLTGSSVVSIKPVKVDGNGQANLDVLTFEWGPTEDTATLPVAGCTSIANTVHPVTYQALCPYGLLRVDLYRVAGLGANPADSLNDSTYSFYFSPSNDSLPPNTPMNATKAYKGATSCNATKCYANITLNDPANSEYYARLSSIYYDIDKVSIVGTLKGTGETAAFKGQTTIDSTGKAQDVLRRIQVQVAPKGQDELIPNSAIHSSGTLCKRFVVGPGYFKSECN